MKLEVLTKLSKQQFSSKKQKLSVFLFAYCKRTWVATQKVDPSVDKQIYGHGKQNPFHN